MDPVVILQLITAAASAVTALAPTIEAIIAALEHMTPVVGAEGGTTAPSPVVNLDDLKAAVDHLKEVSGHLETVKAAMGGNK